MNEGKKYLCSIVVATAFVMILIGLLTFSASASDDPSARFDPNDRPTAATPVTILELHEGHAYISQTVVITGEYVGWDQKYLAISYADFEANEGPSPHSYVVLEGQTPDPALDGSTLVVTGTAGMFLHDYAFEGETEGRRIIVTDWNLLSPPPLGRVVASLTAKSYAAPLAADGETEAQAVDCGCKWAFIVSGGINNNANHQRYRNDIEQKWEYKTKAADYPKECINVFYFDGDGNDLPKVPNDRVQEADKDKIEARLKELAPEMQKCKEKGIKPTLQFLVTDHGSGYHNTNQGANVNKRGIRGGVKVDEDGDESGSAARRASRSGSTSICVFNVWA